MMLRCQWFEFFLNIIFADGWRWYSMDLMKKTGPWDVPDDFVSFFVPSRFLFITTYRLVRETKTHETTFGILFESVSRWWFQICFIFTPVFWGKWSNLTTCAYFSDGWRKTTNHQPIVILGGLGWWFRFLGSPFWKGLLLRGYPDLNPKPPGPFAHPIYH